MHAHFFDFFDFRKNKQNIRKKVEISRVEFVEIGYICIRDTAIVEHYLQIDSSGSKTESSTTLSPIKSV